MQRTACLLLLLVSLVAKAAEPVPERCFLDGWSQPLQCYRLQVGESVSGAELAVFVAPALEQNGLDPVFLLAGGPGQAASDLTPILPALSKVNRQRDLVMVDRRGAGHSGAFACEEFQGSVVADLDETVRLLGQCRKGKDNLVGQLNSRTTVEDLEQVRSQLGYERIALWGGSWGTRTALLYQQWYPASISALVLDGVAPIDSKIFLAAEAAQAALDKLASDCAGDPQCAALGNWQAQLLQLIADWESGGPTLKVIAGQPPIAVTSLHLQQTVRTALYAPEAAVMLPFSIAEAARGNYLPLQGLMQAVSGMMDSVSLGLMFSVACAESVPRIREEEIVSNGRNSFIGEAFTRTYTRGCEVWPVPARDYPQLSPQSHPVLFISGAGDPITPPVDLARSFAYLENKQQLVVQAGAHINTTRGCVPELIERFLDAPQETLDASCVAEIDLPPFMLSEFGFALNEVNQVVVSAGGADEQEAEND
ncbi:alpha/beta fold hydrolase [Biformimicrobium ophioploci]|uniref:Proline iminopeptidase n=1 Tax=Biformimicrobium ophioploci TaxID=3036711 RepID=A0ABQ6M2W5_9GAMM|nr:alpha/beta fold hydrolase [Microbulbifer sp. NKW57]GMG88666.1 alpha/beta fold hydrolase [Microbulbifer sp. NKW57]